MVDGRFSSITVGAEPTAGAARLAGFTIPGLANAHSHAFHRALRSRTQADRGTFWTWRELMYRAAERLQPDSYHRLARATFAEMALAGVTCVGEFHYLHHQPDGTPYADPNEMGEALMSAAAEAGIRITLLDTLLPARSGSPTPGTPSRSVAQRRFSDGSVGAWIERVAALGSTDTRRIGAAIHSVRAVDPDAIGTVARWTADTGAVLHAHVSEQPAENEACLARHGRTPTGVLEDAGALSASGSPRCTPPMSTMPTSRHSPPPARPWRCARPPNATWATASAPTRAFAAAGVPMALGSDSHAVIDLFEEGRALELDERLRSQQRGVHAAIDLLDMATVSGHRCLGWDDAGAIAVGQRADLVSVSLGSVRTAGARARGRDRSDGVRGERRRCHRRRRRRPTDRHRRATRRDRRRRRTARRHHGADGPMTADEPEVAATRSLVIDNIGSLITNDPTIGRGPLGILEHACVVIVDGAVTHVGGAGAIADERIDADGACVLPGFVDSHTHLVFAGDRAEEFTARMAGQPYDGGGIRTTTEATRNTPTDELDRLVPTPARRGAPGRYDDDRDQVGLRAQCRRRGALGRDRPRGTRPSPHSSAPICCPPSSPAAPTTTSISSVPTCSTPPHRTRRGSTRSAKRARSTPTSAERCWRRDAPPVSVCGCTATSSATAPACSWRSSAGARRSTTAPTSATPTSRRSPASDTVATFLPATDFSTRQPYPDARRVIDAGATVAIASNCNPGSSYTTSISFCIALAVRDMHMTIDEAIAAVTVGGAAALRRSDVGRLAPGTAGHAVILDAPTHHHLAYRPGVPLIRRTIGPYGDSRPAGHSGNA